MLNYLQIDKDYINEKNKAEKAAVKRSLGEFVATSYKPRIGHTMGARGLFT